MQMRRVLMLAAAAGLAVLGLAVAAGVAAAQTANLPVGPGDVLQITVYAGGEKQEDFEATVSDAGTISCPLLGDVRLASLRTADIQEKLRAALTGGYYVAPQVLVGIKEYGGKVYLLGEVRNPGTYRLGDAPTVLSACAQAGGWTDFASPRRARVTRVVDGKARQIAVDLVKVRQGKAEDLPLRSGDRVEIPRRVF